MAVAGTSSESTVPQKKFKELPIFIAENHNEVFILLNFSYRLLLCKRLDKTIYGTGYVQFSFSPPIPAGVENTWLMPFNKTNSELTPFVGEVSANFCG
jgi:hypothetical protein